MTVPDGPVESLAAAAATGSSLRALRALRDRTAVELDTCTSKREFASLAQRFMDVVARIDELGGGVPEQKPGTKLDEFTKRLRDREQPAAGARRADVGR